MSECEPDASVDVVMVAVPPLSADVPRTVVPSVNVTEPDAADGETTAVSAMLWPEVDGFADEVSDVVVDLILQNECKPLCFWIFLKLFLLKSFFAYLIHQ